MALSSDNKKHLRGIGHKLNPVVTISNKGLTNTVLAELNRALNDHELIKVKLNTGDRDAKKIIILQVCQKLDAELVQTIGHVILLFRRVDKPNPKLSNLLRKGA